MAFLFDFHALPPEINTSRLLSGPGPASTSATSTAYADLAAQLNAAAADTEATMATISGSWQGMSADKARAAFQKHAAWLQEQAAVAGAAAALVGEVAAAAKGARGAMTLVKIHLEANKAERKMLLANMATASAISTAGPAGAVVGGAMLAATSAALAANELEYLFVIWPEAALVMDGYAGTVVPALAALPKPLTAPPIVGGGAPPPDMQYKMAPDTTTTPRPTAYQHSTITDTGGNSHSTTGNQNTSTSNSHSSGGDQSSGGTHDPSGPGDGPQGTDPTGTGPDSGLSDPTGATDALSPMSDYGQSGGEGYGDDPMAGQDGLYGMSATSPTLAGLTGGIGSAVAFSMMRGGVGSMPGAATGFRMPGNWNPASFRAFGAADGQPTTTVPPRQGPTRGATAPKAQMRRRKDEERKSKSAVFVPGEPMDVPVLEKVPLVGVIEYAGDRREDPVSEPQLAVGVIERVDDDAAIPATPERPR